MRLNEKLIDLLDDLHDIMMKKGQPIKARAYKKAQDTLYKIDHDINDVQQLKGMPFIGDTILNKFETFIREGKLKMIEDYKNKPEYILSNIYGVGPKKAKELVDKGIKNIEDLRNLKSINLI